MKIKELKKLGNQKLKKYHINDATLKVNILLQFILKMNKTELILNDDLELSENTEKLFFNFIEEIKNGRPIQYITNSQEFMGLKFYVDNNVLIPQPDTEILVEETINVILKIVDDMELNGKVASNKDVIKILDLCTGSGAIAVSIENYLFKDLNYEFKISYKKSNLKQVIAKKIKIYASDVSNKALEIAKKNAILNCKDSNIHFILSNMFDNINNIDFDIIVSNPPYIKTKIIDTLSKEVQSEPHIALDGGTDGLDFYRIITKEAKKHLKKNGYLLLEIGYDQKEEIIEMLHKESYLDIISKTDLSGNDRVLKCRFKTS